VSEKTQKQTVTDDPVKLPKILACPFLRVHGEHTPVKLLALELKTITDQQRWVHCRCGASGPIMGTDYEAIQAWNEAPRPYEPGVFR
jgi:hypothetical protein